MSSKPVLNYDILLEVLKWCACPGDCARFMETSRFFYTHGFDALLSHTISISTQDVLLRFLACLQKDPEKRSKYVRSVRFGFFDLSEPAGLELATALRRMSNLETLSISYSEDTILSHPDLPGAFAALSSVRKLDLGYVGETAMGMLRSFRSALVSIDINFLGVAPDGDGFFDSSAAVGDLSLYHPAVILEHSRSSLQEVTSYGWEMDTKIDLDPALVYPQMRRLDLERSLLPRTMLYINAYPNLTHLRFHSGESELDHYHSSSIEDYDSRHELNVAKQIDSGRTWAALREFRGSLIDLYLLGLTCTVDDVHLHHLHDMLHYMLRPALSYVRPRQLTLKSWPADLCSISPADVFFALRGQASSRLEIFCIEARLDKDQDHGAVDIAAILVRVFPAHITLQEHISLTLISGGSAIFAPGRAPTRAANEDMGGGSWPAAQYFHCLRSYATSATRPALASSARPGGTPAMLCRALCRGLRPRGLRASVHG